MKILPVAKEMFLDYYYLKPLNQLTENLLECSLDGLLEN